MIIARNNQTATASICHLHKQADKLYLIELEQFPDMESLKTSIDAAMNNVLNLNVTIPPLETIEVVEEVPVEEPFTMLGRTDTPSGWAEFFRRVNEGTLS